MNKIDLRTLKEAVFYTKINNYNTSTFVELNDLLIPFILELDLYMYRKHLEKPYTSLALAKLFTTFSDHSVKITDFCSTVESVGYGKNLFFNLLKTIDLINKSYKVNKITGYFSTVDYSE